MRKSRVIALVLAFLFLSVPAAGAERAATCTVCAQLEAAGFPEDFREGLCAIQISHPTWNLTALPITTLSRSAGRDYTFSAVLEEECGVWERSLIPASEQLSPYRSETQLRSDTGAYCASREAVAYFLDPRNVLTSRGLFQFLSLSDTGLTGEAAVSRVLAESAAQGIVEPAVLVQLGREMQVDPLFLAVRLRQEQGSEGNPLLTGTAGSLLARWYREGTGQEGERLVLAPGEGYDSAELAQLDGFYNPFNASAQGEGAFAVYYSGACHAREMGWDTVEKALAGGVKKLAEEYILRFQNTLYLQKWNVDVRSCQEDGASRNFWAQYMQNVAAAKTEGDALFALYEEMELLQEPLTFLIPVYEGLPEVPCPDPAGGRVALTAADPVEESPHLVSALKPVEPVIGEVVLEEETVRLPLWKQILFPAVFLLAAGGILVGFFASATAIFCKLVSKRTKK